MFKGNKKNKKPFVVKSDSIRKKTPPKKSALSTSLVTLGKSMVEKLKNKGSVFSLLIFVLCICREG